jgi:hypothetical protein
MQEPSRMPLIISTIILTRRWCPVVSIVLISLEFYGTLSRSLRGDRREG